MFIKTLDGETDALSLPTNKTAHVPSSLVTM